jgi:ABC-type glycerol-3-phosphate transport system substrate-binding protein
MTRRMHALFIVAVASCVLVAGCGGSSHKNPTTPKPAASTKTTTTTTKTTTTTTTTPSNVGLSGAELKAAASGCKSAEADETSLPSSVKSYLSTICADLEAGNVTAFRTDVAKYCSALVAASPAADKSAAQAECDEVGKL